MRAELAESRRAVLTLYDELEEKAAGLHRSAEVRSRVRSTVRHDFRTRLQSIHGLTALLLDRVDGPLTAEQDKQIRYIRSLARARDLTHPRDPAHKHRDAENLTSFQTVALPSRAWLKVEGRKSKRDRDGEGGGGTRFDL